MTDVIPSDFVQRTVQEVLATHSRLIEDYLERHPEIMSEPKRYTLATKPGGRCVSTYLIEDVKEGESLDRQKVLMEFRTELLVAP